MILMEYMLLHILYTTLVLVLQTHIPQRYIGEPARICFEADHRGVCSDLDLVFRFAVIVDLANAIDLVILL